MKATRKKYYNIYYIVFSFYIHESEGIYMTIGSFTN